MRSRLPACCFLSAPIRAFRGSAVLCLSLCLTLAFVCSGPPVLATPDVETPSQADDAARAQNLVALADDYITQNLYADAAVTLQEAYALAGDPHTSSVARNVLNSLANLHYSTGQLELAGRYFQELAALDTESGDQSALAVSLFNLGHVAASSQRLAEAGAYFQRSLDLDLATHDRAGAAYAYKAMGVNAHAQGDLQAARNYLAQSLEIFTTLADTTQAAAVLRNLGDMEQELGNAPLAIEHYLQALPALAEGGMNSALLRTYRGLSLAYEQLAQFDKALVAQRAYTDLLQSELEQQSNETTQRLQTELETRRYADDNARLSAISLKQQQELQESQQIQRLQYLVMALTSGILMLVLYMHKRSRSMAKRLHTLANTDELTRLLNRRAVMSNGAVEWLRTLRAAQAFSCLVIDVDHFKLVNDTFGHAMGDAVLRTLAEILQTTFRQTDAIGRIGGEEFLIFAVSADARQALNLAERIRTRVETAEVPGIGRHPLTISIGIACRERETSLEQLIQHADQALYHAKQQGRNRTVLFSPARQELPRPQLAVV